MSDSELSPATLDALLDAITVHFQAMAERDGWDGGRLSREMDAYLRAYRYGPELLKLNDERWSKQELDRARADHDAWPRTREFFARHGADERTLAMMEAAHATRLEQAERGRVLLALDETLEDIVASDLSRPGPRPLLTAADVDRARGELVAAGKPAGERAIAVHLGVSRDAVRYAMGKDRRPPVN